MMYMPRIWPAWIAVHDLDDGQPALGVERRAPELLEHGAELGVLDRLVVGEEHRDQAGVGGALHVVLAAQRMQARCPGRPTWPVGQRQRDQAARVVGAVDVLRDAHAPEDDRRLGARVEPRHLADRLGGDAAERAHRLRREVGDVLA